MGHSGSNGGLTNRQHQAGDGAGHKPAHDSAASLPPSEPGSMLDLTAPLEHATGLLRRVITEAFLLLRLAVRLWSYLGMGESPAAQAKCDRRGTLGGSHTAGPTAVLERGGAVTGRARHHRRGSYICGSSCARPPRVRSPPTPRAIASPPLRLFRLEMVRAVDAPGSVRRPAASGLPPGAPEHCWLRRAIRPGPLLFRLPAHQLA